MGLVSKLGITSNGSKVGLAFESLFHERSFVDIEYDKPCDYVNQYWNKFNESREGHNPSMNGKMFELILNTLFIREELFPIYLQASVAFVPNVSYDCLFYCKEFGPISISMKTSLRERYKQADLEAIALKYVHRKAKCYLLTMNEEEARIATDKIKSGDIIGLDKIIVCSNNQIDELINELKSLVLTEAGNVDIISSNQIITRNKAQFILYNEHIGE